MRGSLPFTRTRLSISIFDRSQESVEGGSVADNAIGSRASNGATGDQPPSILVVDDDAFIRRVVRDALEGEGFIVATSSDAVEALGVATHFQPTVVILDVHLPDMRGEV